jgi:hypothetical protein
MARICTTVTEWIETNISKPIEDKVEQWARECKKRPWYDPRRWLCWLVRTIVSVVRWVVVTVVTTVITVVCHLNNDLLAVIWSVLKLNGHLLKALFTWDKCALQEAVADVVDALVNIFELLGDVIIRPVVDRVQTYRLRRYAKDLIAKRFTQEDVKRRVWARFNVDTGVFGYRLTCTVHRMFVDSRTLTARFGDVPNLFALHDAGLVDLYQLAGFDEDCALFTKTGWYRPRHQAVAFTVVPAGGTSQPNPPRLTRDQLTEYIDSKGTRGPHFRIYALSPNNLDTRCDTAEEYGRQLGLILDFDRKEIEVTDDRYINYSDGVHSDFLVNELRRKDKLVDAAGAYADLCAPVAVAVFGFTNRVRRGVTDNLIGTDWCIPDRNLPMENDSGASFIDDIPDQVRRFVLIHELGHYFGLCHVDGFDRIMVSGQPGQGDLVTAKAFPNFILHGGPRFIFTEARRVWDFIITNFSQDCLDPGGGVIL